jgi:hypothetical protein
MSVLSIVSRAGERPGVRRLVRLSPQLIESGRRVTVHDQDYLDAIVHRFQARVAGPECRAATAMPDGANGGVGLRPAGACDRRRNDSRDR